MPEEKKLGAVGAYKAVIDQLVAETSRGLSERLVLDEGVFSRAPEQQRLNLFVRSLSEDQRELLATMLHEERTSSIHDVLAVLSWWIEVRELGFTFEGRPMPGDLSGQGLHGDYIGRLLGWEWPPDPSDS